MNDNNTLMYWLGGGLLVVLVLVGFSVWGPQSIPPEDIMPAAGSAAYVGQTSTGITTDRMNDGGAAGTTITTPSGSIPVDGGTTTAE